MDPIVMAIIMLAIVVFFIITNKIPMNFTLLIIPIICALGLGYQIPQISDIILGQLAQTMKSAGYMLLFGLIYFSMLTETGMFDRIVGAFVGLFGERINVVIILIITTVVSALGYLTANISTTYLICFPIMMPIYRKFKLNREYGFIVCQTALAAMCFLPWGIGVANSAMMAGCDPIDLAMASIPWGLCFIPAIILQWVYFAWKHKKENGTLRLPAQAEAELNQSAQAEVKENPNARPKLFWVNLVVFIVALVALAYFKVPAYLVFMVTTVLTALLNYPKNFNDIFAKSGKTYFNVLLMLVSISVYIAIFNGAPEDGSKISMVKALADGMVSIFPSFLMRYMYIIFLLLSVIIVRFVPYQLLNALYPVFISVGATFGLTPIQIIAPFVCNLALGTGVTPMNSSIYVGAALADVDANHFAKIGVPIMTVTNLLVVITAVVFGVLPL